MACWDWKRGHCCWIDGKVCQFLEENTISGRRWACKLKRIHGTWEEVYKTEDYQTHIQPMWDRRGGGSCGSYPGPGETCGECGRVGPEKQ